MTSHLSLAATHADGFYNPPDWDPTTITRDKYHNSKGPTQWEQKGLIRFETPWDFWCTSCTSHVGRGVRYNAKKLPNGKYYSTKLWKFLMRCHICYSEIVFETDPKNRDYVLAKGGRRKNKNYSASDINLMNINDELHKERMELDPIYRLR